MMGLLERKNRMLTTALVMSVGVHIFFLNALIFTFPIPGPKLEPLFVFLGSILQSQDFISTSRNNLVTNDRKVKVFESNSEQRIPLVLPKPSLVSGVARMPKTFSKDFIVPLESISPTEDKKSEWSLEKIFPTPPRLKFKL